MARNDNPRKDKPAGGDGGKTNPTRGAARIRMAGKTLRMPTRNVQHVKPAKGKNR